MYRILARTVMVSMMRSMLQHLTFCCPDYDGSPPNCQRKNDHVIANLYDMISCSYSNL